MTQTRWARYHYWADEAPCLEATERLDGFVDALVSEFELSLPQGYQFDYYKLHRSDQALLESLCGNASAAACTTGSTTYSTDWVQTHELVFEVFNQVGNPPTAFAEGLAEVYGCGDARWVGAAIDRSQDVKSLLPSSGWNQTSTSDYVLTGAFVRYLLDTYGSPAYASVYRQSGDGDGIETIDARFQAVFGTSLDDALSAWRASAPQAQGQICRFLFDACAAAPLLLDASAPTASAEGPVSCLGNSFTLSLSAPTSAIVGFSADQPSRSLLVRPCDFPSDAPYADWLDAPVGWATAYPVGAPYSDPLDIPESEYLGKRIELWTSFDAGTWLVTWGNVFPQDDAGGTAHVDVTLAPSRLAVAGIGQDPSVACESAPPVSVDGGVWSVAITGNEAPLSGTFLDLDVSEPRSLVQYSPSYFGSVGWTASSCGAACQGLPACESSSTLPASVSGPTSVLLRADGASPAQYARLLFRPVQQ